MSGQDSDSDYLDYSDEPLDQPPVGENSISPAQKRHRGTPESQTSSRKGQAESAVQKKSKSFYAARPHSNSAPPRKSSSIPTSKSGSTSEGTTPLSRPQTSKTVNSHQTTTNNARPSSQGDSVSDIAATLKEISNTLSQVVRKIDRQETRLDSMEKKISSRSSISSSSSESGPKKIPPIIRAEVRRVYRSLCDSDENFTGFDLDPGVNFKDQKNNDITDTLIREVKAANPAFQSGMIKGAVYTYYRSLSQEASLERRGKKNERDRERRKRERLNRKLKVRLSVLDKLRLTEEDKRSWRMVIIPELMSSESSCSDSDDDTLVKRQLMWRSQKVSDFFLKLDSHNKETKSTQAKRQMKARVLSDEVSSRDVPANVKLPSWAVSEDNY